MGEAVTGDDSGKCLQFLESLPTEVQASVVEGVKTQPAETFAWLSHARTLNANELTAALSGGGGQTQAAAGPTPLETFGQKYGIDEKCMEYLKSMTPVAQATVVDTFEHQPGQSNVSKRCIAYARIIQQRYPYH